MKKFKFTINGHEYDVELSKFEENIAQIEVNGTMYEIEVQQGLNRQKHPSWCVLRFLLPKEAIPR